LLRFGRRVVAEDWQLAFLDAGKFEVFGHHLRARPCS